MIERKATLFRLYPTSDQSAPLAPITACLVDNFGLKLRREWYPPGRKFSVASAYLSWGGGRLCDAVHPL